MRQLPWIMFTILAAMAACPAGAEGVSDGVGAGNRLMAEGKAQEALAEYDAARAGIAGRPEPVELTFNTACAHLALGHLDEADKLLGTLDSPATRGDLRGGVAFNRGQVEFERARLLAQKTPAEAIDALRRSERFFRSALESLPGDADAQRNVEVAQRTREALEQQVKKQKEQDKKKQGQEKGQPDQQDPNNQQGQKDTSDKQGSPPAKSKDPKQEPSPDAKPQPQDQQEKAQPGDEKTGESSLADTINELTRKQQEESKKSSNLADRMSKPERDSAAREEDRQRQSEGAKEQESLRQKTEDAQKKSAELAANEQAAERKNALAQAGGELTKAQEQQRQAEQDLKNGKPEEAARRQREAADHLAQARRLAAGEQPSDEQKAPEQTTSNEAAQEEPRSFDRDAAQILDKERKEREQLQRWLKSMQRGRPAPVEKDW